MVTSREFETRQQMEKFLEEQGLHFHHTEDGTIELLDREGESIQFVLPSKSNGFTGIEATAWAITEKEYHELSELAYRMNGQTFSLILPSSDDLSALEGMNGVEEILSDLGFRIRVDGIYTRFEKRVQTGDGKTEYRICPIVLPNVLGGYQETEGTAEMVSIDTLNKMDRITFKYDNEEITIRRLKKSRKQKPDDNTFILSEYIRTDKTGDIIDYQKVGVVPSMGGLAFISHRDVRKNQTTIEGSLLKNSFRIEETIPDVATRLIGYTGHIIYEETQNTAQTQEKFFAELKDSKVSTTATSRQVLTSFANQCTALGLLTNYYRNHFPGLVEEVERLYYQSKTLNDFQTLLADLQEYGLEVPENGGNLTVNISKGVVMTPEAASTSEGNQIIELDNLYKTRGFHTILYNSNKEQVKSISVSFQEADGTNGHYLSVSNYEYKDKSKTITAKLVQGEPPHISIEIDSGFATTEITAALNGKYEVEQHYKVSTCDESTDCCPIMFASIAEDFSDEDVKPLVAAFVKYYSNQPRIGYNMQKDIDKGTQRVFSCN